MQMMDRLRRTERHSSETDSESAGINFGSTIPQVPVRANSRGRPSRLPPDFKIPTLPLLLAFQLWCCGNANELIPPLRQLNESQFATRNEGRRFGELKFVMLKLQEAAIQRQLWVEQPTIEQVNLIFASVEGVLSVLKFTATGRERRLQQLAWSSAAKELRNLTDINAETD
jgi:hypothetical protein